MIEEAADFLPMWMFLSAAFGFIIGEALGGQFRVRKCLEQHNAELREQLRRAGAEESSLQRKLDQQRGVINDIHKLVSRL